MVTHSERRASCRRHALLSFFVSVAIVATASVAMAGSPSGTALVDAVDAEARTIVLEGQRYAVDRRAVIVDGAGKPGSLEDIKARPAGAQIVSQNDVDAVSWEAVQSSGRGWVITRLRVIGQLPN